MDQDKPSTQQETPIQEQDRQIRHSSPIENGLTDNALLLNQDTTQSPSSSPSPILDKKSANSDKASKVIINGQRRVSRAASAAPQPPDGGWGWVVVFAAFIACAGVVGLTRAFGIIYVEIVESFPESSALAVSWIPGLYNTLSTGFAPVAGALSNRYSCRKVVFCGGVLMSIGLMLNFFANSVEYLYVTFGIITGCGAGLCTTPGIIMVAKYFKKRRALANGLCLAGTSLGAFVQPLLVESLTKRYTFRGAMLIMGAIMLHISAFSLVYRPLDPPKKKPPKKSAIRKPCAKKYYWFITCLFDRKSYLATKAANIEAIHESKTMLKDPSPLSVEMTPPKDSPNSSPERDESPEDDHGVLVRTRSLCLDHSINDLTAISSAQYQEAIRQRDEIRPNPNQPTGLRKYLDYHLFKNWAFLLFVSSSALTSVGYPHASVFMPTYACDTLGVPKEKTGYLLSITAGADLLGRVGVGYLADLNLFKKMHGYMAAVAMTATATLCLPLMKDFVDLGVNSAFYGLGVGSFFMLTPVILTDNHGPEKVASSYGLLRLFHGVMSLISPPIAGSLSDATGTYIPGFIFMGIAMMIGSFICLLMPKALAYEERLKESNSNAIYQPMTNNSINNASEAERRSSRSSLQSWGRRFSVDPEPEV